MDHAPLSISEQHKKKLTHTLAHTSQQNGKKEAKENEKSKIKYWCCNNPIGMHQRQQASYIYYKINANNNEKKVKKNLKQKQIDFA